MASDTGSDDNGTDPNAWMATFADLLMLLLTFFVLLLTMKSMDAGTSQVSMAKTYGPLDFVSQNEYVPPVDEFRQYSRIVDITSTEMLEEAIDMLDGINPIPGKERTMWRLRDLIDVTESEDGVVITLEADELFDSGDAEIHPARLEVLDAIAVLFRYASNDVLIMGHTDSVPTRGRFGSNWELSVYRALNVLYYMTDAAGLDPGRLAAGGFGDQMPLYPNDTEENRSKNRRVEFLLKKNA